MFDPCGRGGDDGGRPRPNSPRSHATSVAQLVAMGDEPCSVSTSEFRRQLLNFYYYEPATTELELYEKDVRLDDVAAEDVEAVTELWRPFSRLTWRRGAVEQPEHDGVHRAAEERDQRQQRGGAGRDTEGRQQLERSAGCHWLGRRREEGAAGQCRNPREETARQPLCILSYVSVSSSAAAGRKSFWNK